jgi:flagellar hook-associated protein 1
MSLTRALNAATSGLNVNQAAISILSQNIANADTAGYSRRRLNSIETVVGTQPQGVRTARIERMLNEIAQKQLRLETAGASYTALRAEYAKTLDRLFGKPGGEGSLDTALNTFTRSLQSLAADPASPPARAKVLGDAQGFLTLLNATSNNVQLLRTEAEGRIGAAVTRANELLSAIAAVNAKVIGTSHGPLGPNPALLDQRDQAIQELSKLMDVQVFEQETGGVTLATSTGVTVFNGSDPLVLSFDGRSALAPQNAYSTDPAQRSVGTITATSVTGQAMDLIALKAFRSGEIAAAIELRDTTLAQAQRQLDELAAGLSQALSDRPVDSTPVTVAGNPGRSIDLTGLQPGNPVTVNISTGSGQARQILLIPTLAGAPATLSSNLTGNPNALVVPFNISGGIGAAAGSIQTALAAQGLTLNVTSGGANILQITNGGGNTVTGVTSAVTVTGFTGNVVQAPVFVDSGNSNAPYTGSFESGAQITGFAQRIALNPSLLANPALLVTYGPTIAQGDMTRPQFLFDALTTSQRSFSSASGLEGMSAPVVSSVSAFARRVIEAQGANAEALQRLDSGQKVALAAAESRFSEQSGVTIDQELSQLVQLQTAYTANARMMTAVRDMMDVLLRI